MLAITNDENLLIYCSKGHLDHTLMTSDLLLFSRVNRDFENDNGVMQQPLIFSTKLQLSNIFHDCKLILVDRIINLTNFWKFVLIYVMMAVCNTKSALLTFELSNELPVYEIFNFINKNRPNLAVEIIQKVVVFDG